MLLAERLSHSHPSPQEDHRQGLGHFTRKLLFWQQMALGFPIITPARELAITILISRSLVPRALPRQLLVFKVELLFTPTPLFARHLQEGNHHI